MRFWPIAAILLLAGCAPVAAVPPEPTGDELDRLIARELDLQWQYVGLSPDRPRPDVDRLRIVSMDEAEAVHRECMIEQGYDTFRVTEASIFGGADNSERVAIYVCSARYPVLPSSYGIFSEAQLRYLYDYYVEVTVPCLEATGVEVADVPERDEFISSADGIFTMWNPYRDVVAQRQVTYLEQSKCSYIPEGFALF